MKRRILFLLTIFVAALLEGCDLYKQDTYKQRYVVESYLIANRELPQVRVSHTLPLEEKYIFEKAAIENAGVEIHLLDDSGQVETTYPYRARSSGVYLPVDDAVVKPRRHYELEVTLQNNDKITAETIVPGAFHSQGDVRESIVYQSNPQITIHTTPSFYPGRQTYYIFTVNAIAPQAGNLTPFYNDIIDQSEGDNDIQDYYVNSSGIINEGNYDKNEDGTITLRVPWLAVVFYGDNYITANAIDDNMYDFLRSQDVQTGGSTLPPGQVQNIIYHVDGGIGVFGSMASDTVRVTITRPKQ